MHKKVVLIYLMLLSACSIGLGFSVHAQTSITNQATVSGVEYDPNLQNNTSWVTDRLIPVDYIPEADLEVTKKVDKLSAPVDTLLTYKIDYANLGPDPATSTVLTDTIPANSTYISSSPNGVLNGNTLTFQLGNLANGFKGQVEVSVRIKNNASGNVINKTDIISLVKDPVLANNHAEASTKILLTFVQTITPRTGGVASTVGALALTGSSAGIYLLFYQRRLKFKNKIQLK